MNNTKSAIHMARKCMKYVYVRVELLHRLTNRLQIGQVDNERVRFAPGRALQLLDGLLDLLRASAGNVNLRAVGE